MLRCLSSLVQIVEDKHLKSVSNDLPHYNGLELSGRGSCLHMPGQEPASRLSLAFAAESPVRYSELLSAIANLFLSANTNPHPLYILHETVRFNKVGLCPKPWDPD